MSAIPRRPLVDCGDPPVRTRDGHEPEHGVEGRVTPRAWGRLFPPLLVSPVARVTPVRGEDGTTGSAASPGPAGHPRAWGRPSKRTSSRRGSRGSPPCVGKTFRDQQLSQWPSQFRNPREATRVSLIRGDLRELNSSRSHFEPPTRQVSHRRAGAPRVRGGVSGSRGGEVRRPLAEVTEVWFERVPPVRSFPSRAGSATPPTATSCCAPARTGVGKPGHGSTVRCFGRPTGS